MSSTTMARAIAGALAEALEHDASVLVLGEGVGRSGGVAGTCQGLQARFPERVIDTPVAEHGTVGMAVGLAIAGKRPIVEITSTQRLLAVLEALADAASIAARGEFGAPVVVRVPCGDEAGEPVDRPIADLLAAAGVTVVSPSSPAQAAGLLRAACRAKGPVVVLEPRALYGERGDVGEGHWPIGKAKVLREGRGVTLASWGAGVAASLAAADALAAEGVEADVIDLVTLSPVDTGLLGERVRATGRLVVVTPDDAGFGERVLRVALREGFEFLEAPPVAVAPSGAVAAASEAVRF